MQIVKIIWLMGELGATKLQKKLKILTKNHFSWVIDIEYGQILASDGNRKSTVQIRIYKKKH